MAPMKTSHWYKVLVLGGASLAIGCLGDGGESQDAATASDVASDSGPSAADVADAARADTATDGDASTADAAQPTCRVPCSGGICWG